jgi:hypothetical protein
MSHAEPLILYDVPSTREGREKAWSPNTLKIRCVRRPSVSCDELTRGCAQACAEHEAHPVQGAVSIRVLQARRMTARRQTVWVELPDIKALALELGAPPTAQVGGEAHYTLPTLRDPATGVVVTNSLAIAQYLEERFPARPLIPAGTGALLSAFDEMLTTQVTMVRRPTSAI